MPRKGYSTVTISENVYEAGKEYYEAENKKLGYTKYRSMSQFVETTIMDYLKEKGIELLDTPRFEHYNVYEDRAIIIEHTDEGDALAEVWFRGDRVYCDLCESPDCPHIRFLLGKEDFMKKLRDKGFKIDHTLRRE